MKIYSLVTALCAIGVSQFGEAADNFPHTGTTLVEQNPRPHIRSRDHTSLAIESEDIPGCIYMDIYTFCDVTETVTDAGGDVIGTSYSKDCTASTAYFCLKEAMITYDVCVNEKDIGDDIFSTIKFDLSTVNQYFRFKLMLNGMEQEIDPEAYSVFPSPDGSKGLCLRYQTNVDGCKDDTNFTAGVVFFPYGNNIDSQDNQCAGNDPFVFQVDRELQKKNPQQLERRSITLTLPEEVYSATKRLEILDVEGKQNATLYVKETLTRCLDFIGSNDDQSDQRNLELSECHDNTKRFKLKSKEDQFLNYWGKRKRVQCKTLVRLGLLNDDNNNVCNQKINEKTKNITIGEQAAVQRYVEDLCVESCNNCPAGRRGPHHKPKEHPTSSSTNKPTDSPTYKPTNSPTRNPTRNPTNEPTRNPTNEPTLPPPVRSSDLLGCKFLFDSNNDVTPFALGPLKLTTNVLNAIGITGYPRNKYTPIYQDFLVPELITNSCIEFDGSIGNVKSSIIAYSDTQSYSKQLQTSNSLSVDVSGSGSFGAVSVAASAGYAQSTIQQTASTGFSNSAFGRRQTVKEIAKISINCLNKKSIVGLQLKNLILPEVVHDWTFIRNFNDSKEELKKTEEFQRVATGGFLQPTSYLYSATVRLSTDTLYVKTEESDSSVVSQNLTASLSASYGTASVTASVAVSKAVTESLDMSKIISRSETVRIASGTPNITSDCILGSHTTAPNCEEVVTNEVANVFQDINNFITIPSEQIGSVSLDEIVKGIFNDDEGLGELFFQAVDEEYGATSVAPPDGFVYLNTYTEITCDFPGEVIYELLDEGDEIPFDIRDYTDDAVMQLLELKFPGMRVSRYYKLKLNECTLIKIGPPESSYIKISIEGQAYKFIEANNADCVPLTPDENVELYPFGRCHLRESSIFNLKYDTASVFLADSPTPDISLDYDCTTEKDSRENFECIIAQ